MSGAARARAWPADAAALRQLQAELAGLRPPPAVLPHGPIVAASYICFARGSTAPGRRGQRAWAAAARKVPGSRAEVASVAGITSVAYQPGLLALREGALREAAVHALGAAADVLLVDATGRDHPRRAGLALHLGWHLQVPTVGVTDRPLLAGGPQPEDRRGASTPLLIDGVEVARWVRTRVGVRPVAVHAGWRTTVDQAVEVALAAVRRHRTPQPLREARRAARAARGQQD